MQKNLNLKFLFLKLLVISLIIVTSIFVIKRRNEFNKITDPDILRAMNYKQFNDDDKKVDNTGINFIAFFAKDLDGDGTAEMLNGSSSLIENTPNLYMDISISGEGKLKNGEITIQGSNFTYSTAQLPDSIIGEKYVGQTSKIKLNEEIPGGQSKIIEGKIKASLDLRSTKNYSGTGKVTLKGTYYASDEDETGTPIEKTFDLVTDWHGISKTTLKGTGETNTNGGKDLVKENDLILSPTIEIKESANQLILQKQVLEVEIPEIKGHAPTEVTCPEAGESFQYDSENRKVTITKEANIDLDGNVITSLARTNKYKLTVKYPKEAFDEIGGSSYSVSFNAKGWNYCLNNQNKEFTSPQVSSNTCTIRYGFENPKGSTMNVFPSIQSTISKSPVIDVYEGKRDEEYKDTYRVSWRWLIGDSTQIKGETTLEQDKYDEFDNTQSNNFVKTTSIYFSGQERVLGEDGTITVYNKDDDNEPIVTFTKDNWDKNYELEGDINNLKFVMSQPIISNSEMYIYQTKEIDDYEVKNTFDYEEFDELENISTYVKCTYDSLVVSKGVSAKYYGPYSSFDYTISPSEMTNVEPQDVTFTIKANKEENYCEGWVNGQFLLELPDSILKANVTDVSSNNDKVTIESWSSYRENNKNYIKIVTDNDEPETFNITIKSQLTANPLMGTTTLNPALYAYNEKYDHYKNKSQDKYDLNNNLKTDDKIGYKTASLSVMAPSGLQSSEYVTEYNNEKDSRVDAPNIADIEKTSEEMKAKINVGLVSNYTGNITDIVVVGNLPYENNKDLITGNSLKSTFTPSLKNGINIPEEYKQGTTVYYTEDESATQVIDNKWTKAEDVTDKNYSRFKKYLIDFGTRKVSNKGTIDINYEVTIPNTTGVNRAAFASHAVYYSLETGNGKIPTKLSTNKVGIQVVEKYELTGGKNKRGYENVLVPGATYNISYLDANDELVTKIATTDDQGKLVFEDLYIEKEYTLREISASKDFVVSPEIIKFKVVKQEDGTLKYEIISVENQETGDFRTAPEFKEDESGMPIMDTKIDDEARYDLNIKKVEKDSTTPIPEVRFTIKGKGLNETYKSDEQGIVTFPALIPGVEYEIKETTADGYYVIQDPITFSLVRNEETHKLEFKTDSKYLKDVTVDENKEETFRTIVDAQIENEKIPLYNLEIIKVEEDLKEANIEKLDKLEGAKFSVIYQDDDYVKEYTTNQDGKITLEGLYQYVDGKYITGKYTIIETLAPSGYASNNEEIVISAQKNTDDELEVSIENRDNLISIRDIEIEDDTVKLYLQDKPLFELKKKDSETGNPLVAEFIIYEVDENRNIIDYAKDTYDEYVGTKNSDGDYVVKTGEDGIVRLPLRGGIYKAVEVVYPEGYRKDVAENYFIIGNKKMTEVEVEEEEPIIGTVDINYIEDLVDLAKFVNDGDNYKGYEVRLMRNLDFKDPGSYKNYERTDYGDLNGDEEPQTIMEELTSIEGTGFTPIGTRTVNQGKVLPFSGVFNGQGHEISNLYMKLPEESTNSYGFFGYTENAKILNLSMSGTISGHQYIGGIIGEARGNCVIDNVCNKVNISDSQYVGGIIGWVYQEGSEKHTIKISNSHNEGDIENFAYGGGIIGYIMNGSQDLLTIELSNCYNSKEINSGTNSSYIGGLIGYDYNANLIFENCYNTGNIFANSGANEIGGLLSGTYNGNLILENCYNTGNIVADSIVNQIGGLIGQSNNATFKDCYNEGNISSNNEISIQAVGGFIGTDSSNTTMKFEKCHNSGEINIISNDVGGFIGQSYGNSNFEFIDSFNEGNITSTLRIGGFVGSQSNGKTKIINSYNNSELKKMEGKNGDTSIGGFVASCGGDYEITNCYNSGKIEGDILGNGSVGGLIANSGSGNGKISDSKNLAEIEIGMAEYIGGIFGQNYGSSLEIYNSHNESNITVGGESSNTNNSYRYIGGIIGLGSCPTKINSCYNTGTITNKRSQISGYDYIGGIEGINRYPGYLKDVYNTGNIINNNSSNVYIAGVVGASYGGGYYKKVYNTGNINTTNGASSDVGGIVGNLNTKMSFIDIENKGNIDVNEITGGSSSYIGGVIGQDTGGSSVEYTRNSGKINITSKSNVQNYIGGILGFHYGTLSNSYNTGSIHANRGESEEETPCTFYAGGLIGHCSSGENKTISDCYNKGEVIIQSKSISTSSQNYIGGLFGQNIGYSVSNCYNIGKVSALNIDGQAYTGGISGQISGNITKCYNISNIEVTASNMVYSGGIIGLTSGSGKISECYDVGNISANSTTNCVYVGGVAGNNLCNIENCYQSGTINATGASGSGNYIGGITGLSPSNGNISGCIHKGDITVNTKTPAYIGGINGNLVGGKVSNSKNTGNITGAGVGSVYIGGINGNATVSTENCSNEGNIIGTSTGQGCYGGINGQISGLINVTNCSNTGNVTGTSASPSYVGGINGALHGSKPENVVSECNNSGKIEGDSSSAYVFVGGINGQATSPVKSCKNIGYIVSESKLESETVGAPPRYVGGINGQLNGASVSECNNTGKVNVTSTGEVYIGGINGQNQGGAVSNSNNIGDIEGLSTQAPVYSGGINGKQSNITSGSYNSGNIKSTSKVVVYSGGITGLLEKSSRITDSNNKGNIESTVTNETPTEYVGGIVGYIGDSNPEAVSNCYYLSSITIKGNPKNEYGTSKETIEDNNIDKNITTPDIEDNYKELSEVVKDNNWKENSESEDGYPELKFDIPVVEKVLTVSSIDDLVNLAISIEDGETYAGEKITLTKDLDFNDKEELKSNFTGIGTQRIFSFYGEFDGQDFTIKHAPTSIFRYVIGGNIHNLNVKDGGSIVDTGEEVTISNCSFEGNVTSILNVSTGGIANTVSNNSTIENCYTKGTATNLNGGIVGSVTGGGTIKDCHNEMEITSNMSTGGISGSGGTIINCYNTGDITVERGMSNSNGSGGASAAGIVVGNATIYNSHNLGDISVKSSLTANSSTDVHVSVSAGGICSSGTAINCYNTGTITAEGSATWTDSRNSGRGSHYCYVYCGGISGSGSAEDSYNSGIVKSKSSFTLTTTNTNSGLLKGDARSFAGGVVGEFSNTITRCYNSGVVTSEANTPSKNVFTYSLAGGVAGYTGNNAIINDCYNTGDVTSNNTTNVNKANSDYYSYEDISGAGGILGGFDINRAQNTNVSNSYNTGDLTAEASKEGINYAGPIIGTIINSQGYITDETNRFGLENNIDNSYYLDSKKIDSTNKNEFGIPASDYDLRSEALYNKLNVDNIWLHDGRNYPTLPKVILSELSEGTSIDIKNTQATYFIHASYTGEGSIKIDEDPTEAENPVDVEERKYGESNTKKITITPAEGYTISSITINGEPVNLTEEEKELFVIEPNHFTNIDEDKNIVITFTNIKKMFTIEKKGEDDKPLENATFEIVNKENEKDKYTVVTDKEGKAEVIVKDYGTYTVKETVAPEHYILSDKSEDITLSAEKNDSQLISFDNTKKATLTVHHYLKNTQHRVAPDQVSEGNPEDTYTTLPHYDLDGLELAKDESGEYILPKETSGTYGSESKEIEYFYEPKEVELLIHHYREGTEEEVHEDTVEKFQGEVTFSQNDESYSINTNSPYNPSGNKEYLELLDKYICTGLSFTDKITDETTDKNVEEQINITGSSELTYYYIDREYDITTKIKKHTENVFDIMSGSMKDVDVEGGEITGDYTKEYTEEEGIKYVETVKIDENQENVINIKPNETYDIKSIKVTSGEKPEETIYEKDTKEDNAGYTKLDDGSININNFQKVREDKLVVAEFERKQGNVIIHHKLKGSEKPVPSKTGETVGDKTLKGYVGDEYIAYASEDVSILYKVDSVDGDVNGEYSEEQKEVTYYYVLKDAEITHTLEKEAPEFLTEEGGKVKYEIKYNATIKDFKGNATITIEDTLPYKIDKDNSDLAEGDYNGDKTITWTIKENEIDTEKAQEAKTISITKTIYVTYKDDSMPVIGEIVNHVKTKIHLDTTEQDKETEKDSEPSKLDYKIDISGTKTWEDNETQKKRRPENITIELLRDGTKIAEKTIDNSDNAKYDFEQLQKYDAEGRAYNYTVKEKEESHFYTPSVEGYNIKNKFTRPEDKKDITAKVVWEDEQDEYGERPDSVKIKIKDGEEEVETVTVTEEEGWQHTFNEYVYNENGEEITYTIDQEESSPGELKYYHTDIDNTKYVITNTLNDVQIDQELTKTAVPTVTNEEEPIEYTITYHGVIKDFEGDAEIKIVDTLPYEIDEDGSSIGDGHYDKDKKTITWTETRKNINTKEKGQDEVIDITKTIKVLYKDINVIAPIVNQIEGTATFSTTPREKKIEPKPTEITPDYKVSISGTKTWEDNDTQKKRRPENITIELLRNGTKIAERVINNSDNATYDFGELQKYDEKGIAYNYTVREKEESHFYTPSVEAGTYNLKNKFTRPEDKKDITVRVVWEDEQDRYEERPDSVEVKIKDGEKVVETATVTKDESWKHTFNVYVYNENGEDITYTIDQEESSPGELKFYHTDIDNTEYVITNTLNDVPIDQELEKTAVPTVTNEEEPIEYTITYHGVIKDFEGDAEIKIVDTLPYEIDEDGSSIGDGHYDKDKKTITWTETRKNINTAEDGEEVIDITKTIKVLYKDINVIAPIINKIEGTATFSTTPREKKIEPKPTEINPDYKVSISGTKTWEDNDTQKKRRPENITIELLRDGTKIAERTIDNSDNAKYDFGELPKYDAEGRAYEYTVKEKEESHFYTPSVESGTYNLKNKFTRPEDKKDITARVVWEDEQDRYGERPDSVKIKIKDGEKVVETATVTKDEEWQHTFNVYVYNENGEDITYTIDEEEFTKEDLKYYTIDVNNGTYTITNTLNHVNTNQELVKTGPEKITKEGEAIEYNIKYNATIDDLKGNATIKIIDTLPYKIDSSKSQIAEGDYDETNKTITWTKILENVDTEADGPQTVEINKTIRLYYKDINVVEPIVNRIKSEVTYSSSPQKDEITPDPTEVIQDYRISIPVRKIWTETTDKQKLKRPEKITVQLLNGDTVVDSHDLATTDNLEYTFENLPKYDKNGQVIDYKIKEVDSGKFYTPEINGNKDTGFVLNNVFGIDSKLNIDAKVVWQDENNRYSVRPNSVIIVIKDEKGNEQTQTVTDRDGWHHEFVLDEYDENGDEKTYVIGEKEVHEGELKYYKIDLNNENFTITNTLNDVGIDQTLQKDGPDRITDEGEAIEYTIHYHGTINNLKGSATIEIVDTLPYEIEIGSDINGARYDETNKTLTWTERIDNIDTEANGPRDIDITKIIKIHYKNLNVVGKIANNAKATAKFNVTPREYPVDAKVKETEQDYRISIPVTKNWTETTEKQKEKRPQRITLEVLNGETVVASQDLDTKDNLEYSFDDLPKYDQEGNEIKYTVREKESGYFYRAEVSGSQNAGYTVNNIFTKPKDKVKVDAKIEWEDNDNEEETRPDKVVVVVKDETGKEERQTVTKDDDWHYEFTLDKYDENGDEKKYAIDEEEKNPGDLKYYSKEVDDTTYTITNTLGDNEKSITVNKVWNDNNNLYERRPSSVIVELYGDGQKVQEKLITQRDNWQCTFDKLKNINYKTDSEIVYTVQEKEAVKGDLKFYQGVIEGYTITNNFRVPDDTEDIVVRKEWTRDEEYKNEYRPKSIVAILYGDGVEVARGEITAANGWQYTFKPRKYNEVTGKEIVYTIDETEKNEGELSAYTKSISGFLIKNKFTLIDPKYECEIEKDGPDAITSRDEVLNYSIRYQAKVDDYEGDAKVLIVDELPYEIDEARSNIGGGVYDREKKTITWTEEIKDINTFEYGTRIIDFTKNFRVVFKDIDITKAKLVNKAHGELYLGKEPIVIEAESKETDVKLKFNLDVEKDIVRILLNGQDVQISDPKLSKVAVHRKEVNNAQIQAEYVIRVINTESLSGEATIVDELPKDMRFVAEESDPRWVVSEGGKLRAKTGNILPGESTELRVVVKWIGGEDTFGLKSNTAYLEELKGEGDFKEANDEDNKDTAELLIEIKTGDKTLILMSVGLLIVLVELGAIGLISRKRKDDK